MNEDRTSILQSLSEVSEMYIQALNEIENEQEQYWNSMTKEQQLMVFCAVVRRIYKAELIEQRSYRGVLYDAFGFGMESYVQAQDAGYIDIHNLLVKDES
jgi:hypothetical protein